MLNASYNKYLIPINSLSRTDITILKAAEEAMKYAYAPYSRFLVGAAARLKNGQVVIGANQENASYPLCMCGERVALYNASMIHPDFSVDALAIVAKNEILKINKPVSPCGACRQVIREYEVRQDRPIRILLKGDGGDILVLNGITEILPLSFDISYLIP